MLFPFCLVFFSCFLHSFETVFHVLLICVVCLTLWHFLFLLLVFSCFSGVSLVELLVHGRPECAVFIVIVIVVSVCVSKNGGLMVFYRIVRTSPCFFFTDSNGKKRKHIKHRSFQATP